MLSRSIEKVMWRGRLRERGPKRKDATLARIYDALPEDVLRIIALYRIVHRPYNLRPRRKLAAGSDVLHRDCPGRSCDWSDDEPC